jgi:hypothetical protein
MKHYFFEGKFEKGEKLRIYPVSGQFKGSDVINEKLRVSCPKDIRSMDLDTVYVSDDIFPIKTGKYYTVKNFRVLPDSLKAEWEAFSKPMPEVEEIKVEEEVKEPEKKLTLYEKLVTDKAMCAPTSDVDGFFIKQEDWSLLARNVQKHINTMILGPAGTGKTSVIKVLCDKLGLRLHIFDMGSMMDPISSLLGVHRLEDGGSIFDYAKFTQVIQEPCVILLDELSRAPQSAMNILFPCLDDRRSLSIEIACGKGIREIKIHPEVTFIATANVGAEYSGTNSMDRALVNRFFTLELGFIPPE